MPHKAILKRIAINYLDWCNQAGGKDYAKNRLAALFPADTIIQLRPYIIEEMGKRGWKTPPEPPVRPQEPTL